MYQLYLTGNGRFMHHGTYEDISDAKFAGMQAVKIFKSVTDYVIIEGYKDGN